MNAHNKPPAGQPHDADYSEEWLSAYVDDELSDAQRAIVEQRVAVDSEAAAMLRDLQQIRSLVGSLPAWSGELNATRFDDFHDELQPQVPRATGATEQATRDELGAGSTAAASAASRSDARASHRSSWRQWLRPLAAAACILLVLGLSWLLWPSQEIRSVATSSRVEEAAPMAAEQAPEPQAKMAAADPEGNAQSAVAGASDAAADAAVNRALRSRGTPATLGAPAPRAELSPGGYGGAMGASGGYAQSATAATADQPDVADLSAAAPARASANLPASPAADSPAADSPAAAPMLAPGGPSPQLGLQVAYSTVWTPAEIMAGLDRVSALLRRPLVGESESLQAARADTAASQDFPVVVISQRDGRERLLNLLQQNGLALQGPAPGEPLAEVAGIYSLMAPPATSDGSTWALFVSFQQAEQVLELARQANLVVGDPAWISSAALAAEPRSAQQPVVMLFTPQ